MITAEDARNQLMEARKVALVALYESAIAEAVSKYKNRAYVDMARVQSIIGDADAHDVLMRHVIEVLTAPEHGFKVDVIQGRLIYNLAHGPKLSRGGVASIEVSW
jgi:hypothetical protein